MALYQLTLFYPKLRDHAETVRSIRGEVESIAGKNWRVLSAGEQICAIAFESDEEHKQLHARFRSYGGESFQFLLVDISSIVVGYLSTDTLQWLNNRLSHKKSPP
jgi:hypothetical protein